MGARRLQYLDTQKHTPYIWAVATKEPTVANKVSLTWRADAELAKALNAAASEAGVGPSTMVRMILTKYFKNQLRNKMEKQRNKQ